MADQGAESLSKTPLYDDHVRMGARMVPFAGFLMPVQFSGIANEHKAVRSSAGVFDVSHMGELRVQGPEALSAVDRLITNDASKLETGRALYTCACNERGTILDDLIIYHLAEGDVLIVCNASNREKMVRVFREGIGGRASFEDESDQTALIALQGPKAFDVLDRATPDAPSLRKLGSFRIGSATIADKPCTVARTGYTGEDGVELFVAWKDAAEVYRKLLDAGQAHGLVPAGLGARDTLRLEARLSLYGNDIDETTNPIEAGLGWTVKLGKPDFVGKAALEKIKSAGPERKLVGFEVVGRGIARHGYPLLDVDGQPVGTCTSGSPAPTLGKNIGLGYLPATMTEIGTRFLVDCRGRSVEAVVVKTPFYKAAR